ncbi:MAG: 2-dehydropantoate 2-reductase [Zhongshania sp.]|jgi:2-dehydropantoate 2-reductase
MTLRVGIIGAGSIGCYVGAVLQMAGAEVQFLGRERMANELCEHGLHITDYRGLSHTVPRDKLHFLTKPEQLTEVDCLIITVKSGDTAVTARELAPFVAAGTSVVSLQNGVRNAAVLTKNLPQAKVLAGMIAFNVIQGGQGSFHAGTDGAVIIQESALSIALKPLFAVSGTPFESHDDMHSVLWSKLLLNLNNPLNALSGIPLKEQLSQRDYRRCLALLQREALNAIKAAKIPLQRLTAVPASWLPTVMSLPDFLFTRLAQPMLAIDPLARSSMWEDLKRGRKTEVEWLNGEVMRLAEQHGVAAPVNAKLKALIHDAEAGGRRDYTAAELLALLSGRL